MKITVVGYAACPFTQQAKRTLENISKHTYERANEQAVEVELLIKPSREFRNWVRANKLAREKGHVTSPACFIGDIDREKPDANNFIIGGATELASFARKYKLVPKSKMRFASSSVILVGILALLVASPTQKWNRYESTKLAPFGGGYFKDMVSYMFTSLPALGRMIMRKGQPPDDDPHFAENFYFWANSPTDESFLYTIRLSFYGINASTIIPWFHFSHNGDAWDLPSEFESKTLPYESDGVRKAIAPGLGQLEIDCLIPMKEWKIKYEGKVRSMENPSLLRPIKAEFNLHFSPTNNFMYQLHWDELAVARAMASKEWTTEFWKSLIAQNQERYCSLALSVDGFYQFDGEQPTVFRKLDGSRDHNFGIRNWRFILSYIWFPPVKFETPMIIDGTKYEYISGAMTMYGNTFENIVVGGLVSAEGKVCSWSGATPMKKIAPEWFNMNSTRYNPIGTKTLSHGNFQWELAICESRYILEISQKRGREYGYWEHTFLLDNGAFEIHEAYTMWEFRLRRIDSKVILQKNVARGLFEFGKNLAGFDDSE